MLDQGDDGQLLGGTAGPERLDEIKTLFIDEPLTDEQQLAAAVGQQAHDLLGFLRDGHLHVGARQRLQDDARAVGLAGRVDDVDPHYCPASASSTTSSSRRMPPRPIVEPKRL